MALDALVVQRSSGQATSGGSPYTTPKVVDTNPNPRVVETTLVAKQATVNIGNGVTAHAETFNGAIPGPTFNLNLGDTVIVHYQNHLSEVSGIHWHGIELANESDGTPFTQNQVKPGGSFLYKFKVTRPGLFWYHPHHHASTNQVFKGLYGLIVVKDPNGDALRASRTLPPKANTKAMVLSDTTVCKTQGTNDAQTYSPTAPWVGGGALPAQAPPTPKNLCEGPGVARAAGQPLSGGQQRLAAGPVCRRRHPQHPDGAARREDQRGPDGPHQRQERRRPGRLPLGARRARPRGLDAPRSPRPGPAARAPQRLGGSLHAICA